jgi:hypothetical protein
VQLNSYRVNFTMKTQSWSFETDAQGQFFLRHTQGDEWKEDRVELFCDRTGSPRLFMWMVHDTRRSTGRADSRHIMELAAQGISASWQLAGARADGFADIRTVMLQPYEVIAQPAVTEFDNVTLTIDVSQRFLDVLTTAEKFSVLTTELDTNSADGFTLVSLDLDRDKIAGIVRSCR